MASVAATSRGIYRFFVGNLPWTVSGTELKQYFSRFGHVADAKVIFDRETGLTKHYGFVEIVDRTTYDKIINKIDHKLEGRTLLIKETVD